MEDFYSDWIIQKEHLLNDLLSVPQDRPDLMVPLISRALSHYSEYCHRKYQLAERDIFQVFSPHWMTSTERSFLWMGGVKPCVMFRLIPTDLTFDQRRQVDQLKRETIEVEREIEQRMRMVHDAMTVLMVLATVHGSHRNGDARADATDRVAELMRGVFFRAEGLRRNIVARCLEILNTCQIVRFFAGATCLHLRLRRSGLRHNAGPGATIGA